MVDREEIGMGNEEITKNDNIVKEELGEHFEADKIIEAVEDDEIQVSEEKEDSRAVKFIKRILATTVDQIISIAIALVLLIVFDVILKLIGFYIAERKPMFLIVYVIVNIIYTPICESTRLEKTIGKKTMLK